MNITDNRYGSLDGGSVRYNDNTNTEKDAQTSMPQIGFQSTVPVLERENIFYALDRGATVIRSILFNLLNF
jgi:hypothetical protein